MQDTFFVYVRDIFTHISFKFDLHRCRRRHFTESLTNDSQNACVIIIFSLSAMFVENVSTNCQLFLLNTNSNKLNDALNQYAINEYGWC